MKKYARSEFHELIVLSEKARKKGGSLASIFKLIQDLIEFEDKIQECINAQEMQENADQISSFLGDIDKMYDVLLNIAREGISAARNQRVTGVEEEVQSEQIEKGKSEEPAPEAPQPSDDEDFRLMSVSDLKKHINKPKAPMVESIPPQTPQ